MTPKQQFVTFLLAFLAFVWTAVSLSILTRREGGRVRYAAAPGMLALGLALVVLVSLVAAARAAF